MAFQNLRYFLLVSCRGKKDPAKIWMQKRRQHANHLQHISGLAEEERLHESAVESLEVNALAVAASSASDGPSPYPTSPGAPRKDQCSGAPLVAKEVCLHNLIISN